MKSNSWIIVRRSDGAAILETWNPTIVAALNLARYEALTAYDYLCQLNARIKEARAK